MPSDAAGRVRALVERRGVVTNADVVRALSVSPATSHRLLRALVVGGMLEPQGKGRAARYHLPHLRRRFAIAGLAEDQAWQRVAADLTRIRPLETQEATSLRYAATEVINNAIEHSSGRTVVIDVAFEAGRTTVVSVRDDGVGVFHRVCEDFGFASPHEAIVHLEKGKLTSDPARHSGEGLFFSSKAVARFRLESQGVAWVVDSIARDSGVAASDVQRGTRVVLTVVDGHTPHLEDVFRAYTDPESLEFVRTRTTVKLAALGTGLVSRSEARRLTARLGEFKHVTLDFTSIELVGQGFCDEVFRVFAREHPGTAIEPVGMNDAVAFMVARARAR